MKKSRFTTEQIIRFIKQAIRQHPNVEFRHRAPTSAAPLSECRMTSLRYHLA